MSHTPGPWMASYPVNVVESHVRDENGVLICKCYSPDESANAKLIAAAPELLAAMEEIQQRLLGKVVVNHDDISAVCTIVCKTLDKIQDGKI